MVKAHESPTSRTPESSSSSGNKENESGNFECNICFDLARDPVITLCGHLYCWPCLYKWLRGHSQSHECPVCKALVEEEKVIPLYGREKASTDPRSKPVPGFEIPNRPAGQRPETAIPPEATNFINGFSGLMGGFGPMKSATFNNIGISVGFGGMLFPFFSVQFQGFSGSSGYSGSPGYNYGSFRNRETSQEVRTGDENLKKLLFVIIFFVFVAFLTM